MEQDVFAPYGAGPLGAMPLTGTALARAQFLTWLKQTSPGTFRHALKVAETAKAHFEAQSGNPAALSGVGLTTDKNTGVTVEESKSWWSSLAEGITSAGTAYLAYKGQKAAIDMNLERARMGLPPIDVSRYSAPTVRTQVDVSPEILARLQAGGMNTLLLVGGIAAAFFVLPKLLGGSRRR